MRRNAHRGFTLLELLVVVIIIGILAAVALPQFGRATEKARQAEAMSLLGAIRTAELIYYQENSKFTNTTSELSADIPADTSLEHYFKYSISGADAADFKAKATRKLTTDTGKSPGFSSAYYIEIDRIGTITKSGAP